jgi:hypothetical protein
MTAQDISTFLQTQPNHTATIHDIVNNFLEVKIVDPSNFDPPGEYLNTPYYNTLKEVEQIAFSEGWYIMDAGNTIGLSNSPTFNRRIARTVSL